MSDASDVATTGEGTAADSSEGLTPTDGSPNTELIAVIDFNRLYDSNGDGSGTNKTEYGSYFEVLETCHSLNTEDAAYVIQKCIDNDSAGEWSSLKDSVDASVVDADDLILDLASFLNSVEAVEASMNFKRDDENIASAAVDFFEEIGSRSYEKDPSQTSFTISSIYGSGKAELSNSEIVKTFIEVFRSEILFSDDYESLISYLKTDLNVKQPWSEIDKLGSTVYEKLVACSEIISKIMAVSSGASLVEQDDINDEVAFDISNPTTIFYGTKTNDRLPFGKKISDLSASRAISLPFLQYHLSDKTVLPLETDDPTVRDGAGRTCLSGPEGLVRNPISVGDLSFTDLDSYCQTTTKNFETIVKFLTYTTGRFDTSSQVSPPEILRIIVNRFISATKTAVVSDETKLQFATLALAANTDQVIATGEAGELESTNLRQLILQSVGRLKWYETQGVSGMNTQETGKVTLLTTRTSEGSASLASDASPTTTQVEDKSAGVAERVVKRRASGSPSSSDISTSFFTFLEIESTDTGETNADEYVRAAYELIVEQYISSAATNIVDIDRNDVATFLDGYFNFGISDLTNLDQGTNDDVTLNNIEIIKNSIINAEPSVLENCVNDPDWDTVTADRVEDIHAYLKSAVSWREEIDKLSASSSASSTYLEPSTVESVFESAQSSSSNNVFNCILDAYDEILSAATGRISSDATITNSGGYTKYRSLDEFALLSLIVECFVGLAGLTGKPYLKKGTVTTTETEQNIETNKAGESRVVESEKEVQATGISIASYSLNDLSTLESSLSYVTGDSYSESSMGPMTYPEAYQAFVELMRKHEKVRNSAAYMSAYLKLLSTSKDELVTVTNDLISSSTRSDSIKTEGGYKMLSDLTTQQIIRRRSMLDKYRPQTSKGYVPARASYYSSESSVFDLLLQSSTFANREGENIRIAAVGIPAGFLPSSLGPSDTGMVNIDLYRKDYEFDDISFSPKTHIFDPMLFIQPGGFTNFSQRSSTVSSDDYILSLASRVDFTLYSRSTKQVLTYDSLRADSRYSLITDAEFEQIVRNTLLSYMMETYIYKLSGKIFDETLTIRFDDSTSDAGQAALKTSAALGLTNLVLPTSDQLDQIFDGNGEVDHLKKIDGVTTGDKELIDAISSSFLMRSSTVLNRTILSSNFDRIFLIPFDLDEFEIDGEVSVTETGDLATSMLASLSERGWSGEVGTDEYYKIINRDPINGGVSIGNICCQASLHTVSTTS